MKTPTMDVGNTDRSVSPAPKSNTVVLGASMPYDSLKSLEQVMFFDQKLNKLRDEGLRPNKTDLIKMSLILFFNSPISKERLMGLWNLANNDDSFQSIRNQQEMKKND